MGKFNMKHNKCQKYQCKKNPAHRWWVDFDEKDAKIPENCSLCKVRGVSLGIYFYYNLAALGRNKTSLHLKVIPTETEVR